MYINYQRKPIFIRGIGLSITWINLDWSLIMTGIIECQRITFIFLMDLLSKNLLAKPALFTNRYWLNQNWVLGRDKQLSLQWRNNACDGVSNHQPHDCLLKRLFRRRSKKTSKLRVTGLCEGNSPVAGEFPAQRASYTENASIWWRHHDLYKSMRWNNESMPYIMPYIQLWF